VGEKSCKAFTGSLDYKFKIVEYEVYKVIFDKAFEKKLFKPHKVAEKKME